MITLTLMQELRGEMGLVLADAPLFSGKLSKYKVVTDIAKVNPREYPYAIACNGVYTWRAKDAILTSCFCRKSMFKLITTVNSPQSNMNIYNKTVNLPTMANPDTEMIFKHIVGGNLTDQSIVLYAVNTHCPVYITKPHVPVKEVKQWASTSIGPWDTFEDMLEEHIKGLKPEQSRLIVQGLQNVVASPMHSKYRQILNAYTLLQDNDWRPKHLVLWLLNAAQILENAKKEEVSNDKEARFIG